MMEYQGEIDTLVRLSSTFELGKVQVIESPLFNFLLRFVLSYTLDVKDSVLPFALFVD